LCAIFNFQTAERSQGTRPVHLAKRKWKSPGPLAVQY
jgi:hypothetical protein